MFLDLIQRIEERSIEVGDCWIWQGAINNNGAPMISYRGKVMSIHRALCIKKGRPVKGKLCYAKCGEKKCVNPDHVGIQTQAEAIARSWDKKDKVAIIRQLVANRRGSTGITDEMVKEMRNSSESIAELAKRFGKHRSTVSKIVKYETRRDMSSPWAQLWR